MKTNETEDGRLTDHERGGDCEIPPVMKRNSQDQVEIRDEEGQNEKMIENNQVRDGTTFGSLDGD